MRGVIKVLALCCVLACTLPVAALSAPAETLTVLGNTGTRITGKLPPFLRPLSVRWKNAMEHQQAMGPLISKDTKLPAPVIKQWENLAAKFPQNDAPTQLSNINGFFNVWKHIPAKVNYGKDNYWACAGEFLEKGGGDRADFPIAKYQALRQLGWPAGKLFMLIVKDVPHDQSHMLLAASLDSTFVVLDTNSRPAYLILDQAVLLKRYEPLLAINEDGIWVFPEKK